MAGTYGATRPICLMARDEKHALAQRAWKERNREAINAKRRADYAARRGLFHARELARCARNPKASKASSIAKGIVARSKAAGWPRPEWVSQEAILDWFSRQPSCACCGQDFAFAVPGSGWVEASPSFDRLDPLSDYRLSNVRLICWRCNNIKRNYSAADLRLVAAWIDRESGATDHPG